MRFFWAEVISIAIVSIFIVAADAPAQCKLTDRSQDAVFITFEKTAKVKVEDLDEPQDGVLLRVHNNSSCAIVIKTFTGDKFYKSLPKNATVSQIINPDIEYDLYDGVFVPDLDYSYYTPYKRNRNFYGDVGYVFRVQGNQSVLFGVPLFHLDLEGGLELPFQYTWEAENRAKHSYGSVQSFVRFSSAELPDSVKRRLVNSLNLPRSWFAPINDTNKPDWEILPQEARAGEVILSKRNELGILSNFAATPFELDGKRYASVEGFWQMMLYPEGPDDERAKDKRVTWKYTREQVAQMTAFDAKSAGTLAEENMKSLGIDWCTFDGKRFPYRSATPGEHYRLIVAAMHAKVDQNPEVKRILLATGDLILKPDHHGEADPPPEWRYCELLTQIRSELRTSLRP